MGLIKINEATSIETKPKKTRSSLNEIVENEINDSIVKIDKAKYHNVWVLTYLHDDLVQEPRVKTSKTTGFKYNYYCFRNKQDNTLFYVLADNVQYSNSTRSNYGLYFIKLYVSKKTKQYVKLFREENNEIKFYEDVSYEEFYKRYYVKHYLDEIVD